MIDKERLIAWCWENIQFYNCPETWQDTEIVDILNGCQGSCHLHNDKIIYYSDIRWMFRMNEEKEDRIEVENITIEKYTINKDDKTYYIFAHNDVNFTEFYIQKECYAVTEYMIGFDVKTSKYKNNRDVINAYANEWIANIEITINKLEEEKEGIK